MQMGTVVPGWGEQFPSASPLTKGVFKIPVLKLCVCVRAKSLQSCLTLRNTLDSSPPGSSVHGILQQEHWSGLLCPPPEDLSDPGIRPESRTSPALAGGFFTTSATWEVHSSHSPDQLDSLELRTRHQSFFFFPRFPDDPSVHLSLKTTLPGPPFSLFFW